MRPRAALARPATSLIAARLAGGRSGQAVLLADVRFAVVVVLRGAAIFRAVVVRFAGAVFVAAVAFFVGAGRAGAFLAAGLGAAFAFLLATRAVVGFGLPPGVLAAVTPWARFVAVAAFFAAVARFVGAFFAPWTFRAPEGLGAGFVAFFAGISIPLRDRQPVTA